MSVNSYVNEVVEILLTEISPPLKCVAKDSVVDKKSTKPNTKRNSFLNLIKFCMYKSDDLLTSYVIFFLLTNETKKQTIG